MNELVLSLDIFAAILSILVLGKFALTGGTLEDIVLLGGTEKRSLMNQHVRRRHA